MVRCFSRDSHEVHHGIKLKFCRTLPLDLLFAAPPRRLIFATFLHVMDVDQNVAELKDWFVCK
jgi:hypothetical protein